MHKLKIFVVGIVLIQFQILCNCLPRKPIIFPRNDQSVEFDDFNARAELNNYNFEESSDDKSGHFHDNEQHQQQQQHQEQGKSTNYIVIYHRLNILPQDLYHSPEFQTEPEETDSNLSNINQTSLDEHKHVLTASPDDNSSIANHPQSNDMEYLARSIFEVPKNCKYVTAKGKCINY